MRRHKPTPPSQELSPASLPVTRRARPWGTLPAARVVFLCLLLASHVGIARLAQEQPDNDSAVSREYQIKAAYLYQFGRYVEWPQDGLRRPSVAAGDRCLEGRSTFLDLDQLVETKKVQDRPIEIRRFSLDSDFTPCHILFLSAAVHLDVQAKIIRPLSGKNVLLVGETDEFIKSGGVINFVTEDYRVRLYVDRKAAKRQGLQISSKLLQVAHVVN